MQQLVQLVNQTSRFDIYLTVKPSCVKYISIFFLKCLTFGLRLKVLSRAKKGRQPSTDEVYHELSKRQDRFCLNIFLAAFDYWTVQTQALHFVTLHFLLSRRCQNRPPSVTLGLVVFLKLPYFSVFLFLCKLFFRRKYFIGDVLGLVFTSKGSLAR